MPPYEPSVSTTAPAVELADPPSNTEQPEEPELPEEAPSQRWLIVLVALIVAGALGLWWPSADPPLDGPDAGSDGAARVADARTPDVSPMPDAAADAEPDAEPDTAPDSAPTDSAAPVDAAPPPADSRPSRRPIPRPRRDARVDAARPTAPADAAAAPAPVDASAPDAERPSPAPSGPRVRLFSPGARVAGPASSDGWWIVPPGGLLLRVVDGPGPPVILRIKGRGGRFEAAVNAVPWGQVFIGARDLGATPAAAVPLEAGRQTLRVVGPDQQETVIRIEASRD